MDKISIIVPCYNEEEAMPIFYKEITKMADKMKKKAEFEFINNPNLGAKGENGPDVEVLKGITAWEFDKENDEYKDSV